MANKYRLKIIYKDINEVFDIEQDKSFEELSDIINTYENVGLLNTLKIVDSCNLELPKASLLLPLYLCPEGVDASIYLASLAKTGLKKRLNNNVSKLYLDRLIYELNIINNMGFANYFLVVY